MGLKRTHNAERVNVLGRTRCTYRKALTINFLDLRGVTKGCERAV